MSTQIEGRILIVDDQENWRKVLSLLLETDYVVKTVDNDIEAEKAIGTFSFDVVVLDVRLIDKDIFDVSGIALIEKIKKQRSNTGVILLTGYPDSLKSERLQKYGADAYFLKAREGRSFDVDGFRKKVHKLVALSRSK
jgi:DNA-binding NtrC family response regulator